MVSDRRRVLCIKSHNHTPLSVVASLFFIATRRANSLKYWYSSQCEVEVEEAAILMRKFFKVCFILGAKEKGKINSAILLKRYFSGSEEKFSLSSFQLFSQIQFFDCEGNTILYRYSGQYGSACVRELYCTYIVCCK
jgi:hypothetical protein